MIQGLVHYQVLARWARGGMADVFVARQVGKMGFDKLVALKVLRGDLLHDQELRQMFIQEARTAVLLNHPRIIQTYDAEEAGDNLYLVMEFVRGETLRHVVQVVHKAGETLPTPFALEVVHQIGLALDYAHRLTDLHGTPLSLVHRDVAPSNIMLTDQGGTKLLDFGIAKVAAAGQSTDAGTVKGKFAYMSPEQVRGKALDGRSDVYALGLVMWELLTGKRALVGERDVDIIRAALKPRVPAPSTVGGPKIEALDRLVMRALAPSPDARMSSARELAEEAERLRTRLFPDFNMSACVRGLLETHFADRKSRLDELISNFEDSSSPGTFSPMDLETHPSADAQVSRVEALPAVAAESPYSATSSQSSTVTGVSAPHRARWKVLSLLLLVLLGGGLFFFSRGPTSGAVVVTTEPPGATVRANGESLGQTPLEVLVHAGAPVALTFSRPGYAEASRIVSLEDDRGVSVRLERSQAAGTVTVRTTPPGASVSVDGDPREGQTPLLVDGLWIGRTHRIAVRLVGYEPLVREVSLGEGDAISLDVPLTPLARALVPQPPRPTAAALPTAAPPTPVDSHTSMESMRPRSASSIHVGMEPPATVMAPDAPLSLPDLPELAIAPAPPPPLPAVRPPLPPTVAARPSPVAPAPPPVAMAAARAPSVHAGMPRVTGVVDRAEVRRSFRALSSRFEACLLQPSVPAGRVQLRLVVDEAGRARDVSVTGAPGGAAACLRRALRSAAFPGSTASDATIQLALDVRRP